MANKSSMNMVNDGGSKPRVGAGVANAIATGGQAGKKDDSWVNLVADAVAAQNKLRNTPTSRTGYDSSDRNQYLASLKAQLDAQTAAYDQLLAYNQQMYEEQKKVAAQNREDNARRAYIAKEMALKNMPGQLAREGINGGLAETSYVRLNNRYARSLAEGDSDYSDAVSRAYLDMVNANRDPQTGKMNAQASYTAGLQNAPRVKSYTTENEAYKKAQQEAYNKARRTGLSHADALKFIGMK